MDHQDDITQPLYVAQEDSLARPELRSDLLAVPRGKGARHDVGHRGPTVPRAPRAVARDADETCSSSGSTPRRSRARGSMTRRATRSPAGRSATAPSSAAAGSRWPSSATTAGSASTSSSGVCKIESIHGVSLDVFANETSARGWLRVHAAAVATADAKLRRFAY